MLRQELLCTVLICSLLGCITATAPSLHDQVRSLLATADEEWNYNSNGNDWIGTCKTGRKQSPIAIDTQSQTARETYLLSTFISNLKRLLDLFTPTKVRIAIDTSNQSALMPLDSTATAKLTFPTVKGLRVINTGHSVEIQWDSLEGPQATVPVEDNVWNKLVDGSAAPQGSITQVPVVPLQFHLHAACEHIIDGDLCPMELHIVTKVDNTTDTDIPEECQQTICYAVFGISYRIMPDAYGPGAEWLDVILDNLPEEIGSENANFVPSSSFNISSLIPENATYVTYSGSLTTPPCSENLRWHVFLNHQVELSADQVNRLEEAFATATEAHDAKCAQSGDVQASSRELSDCVAVYPQGTRTTNRAVQPLNGRTIFVSI